MTGLARNPPAVPLQWHCLQSFQKPFVGESAQTPLISPHPFCRFYEYRMIWYLLIGTALSGWSVLLVLSGERQRRLQELHVKQQQMLAEQSKPEETPEIPTVG